MHKMSITKIRIFRWMCGKTRKARIRNECFRELLWATSIGDKFRETPLRWSGHVQYRPVTAPLGKSFSMGVDGPTVGVDHTWREGWMSTSSFETF